MRKLALIAAVVSLTSLGAFPARATGGGTMKGLDPITWQGATYTPTSPPVPDTFDLQVALGSGFWNAYPGGIEVSIRWTSEYDVFDLYVLNASNQTIASATGFPTSAESLFLAAPPDGMYHIVVVPTSIQTNSDQYEGIAKVQLTPQAPHHDALPNLHPLPADNFKLVTGALSLVNIEHDPSCYPDEVADYVLRGDPPLEKCLRFDAAMANVGEGPFELQLDLTTAHVDPNATDKTQSLTGDVHQEIFATDGSSKVLADSAGAYVYHPTHAHMHYKNFATYSLYKVTDDGDRGPLAVASRKSDFCMIDTRLLRWDDQDISPRRHHFPHCDVPGLERGEGTKFQEGIDPGWADVYTWDLPGQFIDISHVDDGIYDVVIQANPAGALVETDTTDNCSATRIELSGAGAAVTSLGPVAC